MEEKEIKLNIGQEEYLRLKSLLGKYLVKEKKQKDSYFDTDSFFMKVINIV